MATCLALLALKSVISRLGSLVHCSCFVQVGKVACVSRLFTREVMMNQCLNPNYLREYPP